MKRSPILFSLSLLAIAALTACGKYNYVKAPTKEEMAADTVVYGKAGGPPYQMTLKYANNPEAAQRSAVLKELLFNENARKAKVDTAKAMKSMQE